MWPIKIEFATRVHDLCEALTQELGGQLTVQEELLVRSIATYSAQLDQYTEVWLFKLATPEALDRYERTSNYLNAAMENLRALRKGKNGTSFPGFDVSVHRNNKHDPSPTRK